MYDSNINRSIMLKDELNDMRNDIMRRTKSNQIKRRFANKAVVAKAQQSEAGVNSIGMVRKDVNQLDVEQQEWKVNFTDYIKNMVTNKTNVTTTASTRQGSKSQRKRLLQAI